MPVSAAGAGRPLPLNVVEDFEPAAEADWVGLSRGHIPPCDHCDGLISGLLPRPVYLVRLARGGKLVELRASSGVPAGPRAWRRSTVTGFSRRSRGRLLKLVNSIDDDHLRIRPLFLTLTYPSDYPVAPARYKRDLEVLWKRLERGWLQPGKRGKLEKFTPTELSAIWRLELQERGAPHFHCILFGINYLHWQTIARLWYEVVGSGDERHLYAGTRIERPDYWDSAGGYLGKYVAKQAVSVERPAMEAGQAEWSWDFFHSYGRSWGVLGRRNLPTSIETYDVPEWVAMAVKNVILAGYSDREPSDYDENPYRGAWGTCGADAVDPILSDAGLLRGDDG